MTSPLLHNITVCWIGNPRYSQPLSPTDDKKWALLEGLGIKMLVIGFAVGLRPQRFTQHAHFYLLPELPISVMRYGEMFLLAPFVLLWLVLRHDVQIIVAGSPFEGAVGALVKNVVRLAGKHIGLVVESHGDFEVSALTQRRITFTRLYQLMMKSAARYGLRHADALRAISSMTERQLQQYAPNKPIERFITWTDSRIFRDTPRSVPLAQSHEIVCAAVLIPRKGIHFLIEAFAHVAAEFPAAHFSLIGKTENPDYARQLEEQVTRLKLYGRVTFVGDVSQAELARHMAAARVLVLPSISEGLGRVLIEAMLCGTPVIGSNVDGIPDVVQDGQNGYLVPPGDSVALTDRLRQVLSDPNIEVMGQRARAFAEQFFSEASYMEGYRNLLETTLQRARAKR